jgi:hypothetical protein
MIEDEYHFVIQCQLYEEQRELLFKRLSNEIQNFSVMDGQAKFISMMNTQCPTALTLIGKFIYNSFTKRALVSD